MLEAIKNAFAEAKEKPEHIKTPVPMPVEHPDPQKKRERLPNGHIRVLESSAPGCAFVCTAVLKPGDPGYEET